MTVNVLLSGRLQLDGYGQGRCRSSDGTFQLDLSEGTTVRDLIGSLGVPSAEVALMMRNARQCPTDAGLKSGDRIILIPPDVAALWRFFGCQNLGAESVFDF
jgi:sulfur carrier protein ThiS